jgi:hypothetical protein
MRAAPIDNVLAQLGKVRQRQPGQFSAQCPAHADNGPSLSVRETPEGAVLLHCFAGCPVGAVVDAMGLDMSALFPPRERSGREPQRQPRLLSAPQALELLDREAHLVAVAALNVAHGVVLGENDRRRLNQAAGRIHWLCEEALPLGGAHA